MTEQDMQVQAVNMQAGMADLGGARWFKSSASSVTGCVEVAHLLGGPVAVRDSKDTSGPVHVFGPAEWATFVSSVKYGSAIEGTR
jgi:hypothetical protein